MGLALFYTITQFLTTENRFKTFENMILICILFNLCFCLYEIVTLKHSPNSRYYNELHYIPTAAFNNQNDLPSVILICMPILLFIKDTFKKYLAAFTMLFFMLIVIVQQTRSIMSVFFLFFLHHFIFKTNYLYKIIVIATLLASFFIFYTKNPAFKYMFNKTIYRIDKAVSDDLADTQLSTSSEVRKRFYVICANMFVDSYGMGVGIGNFEKALNEDDVRGVIDAPPHTMFGEMLATEGLIGFGLLVLIVFSLLYPFVAKFKKGELNILKLTIKEKKALLFFFFFMVSTAIPATPYYFTIYWSMLAYYYALLNTNDEGNINENTIPI